MHPARVLLPTIIGIAAAQYTYQAHLNGKEGTLLEFIGNITLSRPHEQDVPFDCSNNELGTFNNTFFWIGRNPPPDTSPFFFELWRGINPGDPTNITLSDLEFYTSVVFYCNNGVDSCLGSEIFEYRQVVDTSRAQVQQRQFPSGLGYEINLNESSWVGPGFTSDDGTGRTFSPQLHGEIAIDPNEVFGSEAYKNGYPLGCTPTPPEGVFWKRDSKWSMNINFTNDMVMARFVVPASSGYVYENKTVTLSFHGTRSNTLDTLGIPVGDNDENTFTRLLTNDTRKPLFEHTGDAQRVAVSSAMFLPMTIIIGLILAF